MCTWLVGFLIPCMSELGADSKERGVINISFYTSETLGDLALSYVLDIARHNNQ